MVFSNIVESTLQWAIAFIQAYGPWSVFIVVLLEELFLPIPSPLVIMGAGYALIPASLSLQQAAVDVVWIIVIPASIASTIGSFFAYFIGYYGGKAAVVKFQKFLGFGWNEVEKAEKRFEDKKSTWIMIAVLRAIPFFPVTVVSLAAGVLHLNKWKYALATFLGSIPRVFVLGLVGWYFGPSYTVVANKLNLIENGLFLVAILVIIYLLYRLRSMYLPRAHMAVKKLRKSVKKKM